MALQRLLGARRPLTERKSPIYTATSFGGDGAAEFAKRYQAKFHAPAEPHAALAYDDARITFEMLKKLSVDPAKMRDDLGSLKEFAGVTSPLAIDDGAIHRPVFIGTLTGGVFSTVK